MPTPQASQVTFGVSGADATITTPDGVITLERQFTWDIGHVNTNIEAIVFADGTLDQAAIRARAVADQATAGADAIAGTGLADTIGGGAGNDVLTGGGGADTFVFTLGDGDDQITDFSIGADLIEFAGLTFAGLTIAQVGNDTVIDYSTGDVLHLLGIDQSLLSQSDFVFV